MRKPAFTKGPWRSTFTLGNGAHRILARRGYVATVESPDDARLIKKAPELYDALDTLALDVRNVLDMTGPLTLAQRSWLEGALRRINELLNEVDGK